MPEHHVRIVGGLDRSKRGVERFVSLNFLASLDEIKITPYNSNLIGRNYVL